MLSIPFRIQVIALLALPLVENEQAPHPLCPVRALRVYIERSGLFWQSEQLFLLFVSFRGRTKGLLVLKHPKQTIQMDCGCNNTGL